LVALKVRHAQALPLAPQQSLVPPMMVVQMLVPAAAPP
jgi:hypothetical protein